jgi:hypothetical protein
MYRTCGISPDDIITQVTEAPTAAAALDIMRMQSRGMVLAVADLLYVDDGASLAVMRRECVTEARAGVPERTITASAAETPGTIASVQAFGWGA